ncbi:MAG: nucleoside deaminase [Treponema sp.]|jgi:tRNA(Arg) A34 adenosine deaminase TadA|nr:nucleoside deaminase [Treponema sp.]
MTPEEIMRYIVRETKKEASAGKGGVFGAAVVRNGEIVAFGTNQVFAEQDPSAHGEVVAIRRAAKKLGPRFPKGTTLYTTSQSCPMCVATAIWAGIEKIYFSATCEDDHVFGLSDRHVYEYLRGDENPGLLSQEQILPGLTKTELLPFWEDWAKR